MGAYETTVLADSPVGYWELNETSGTTAYDSSGHGANGTIGSGVTLGQPGPIISEPSDTSYEFTNTSGSVSVTEAAPSSSVSVEAWVQPTSTAVNYGHAAGYRNDSTADFYLLQLTNSDSFECRFVNSSGGTYTLNVTVPVGSWHHLVMTYDGTTQAVYLDGTLATSQAASGSLGTDSAFSIGNNVDRYGFTGYIAQVALYDSALSAARVQAHYEAAFAIDAPGAPPVIPLVPTTAAVSGPLSVAPSGTTPVIPFVAPAAAATVATPVSVSASGLAAVTVSVGTTGTAAPSAVTVGQPGSSPIVPPSGWVVMTAPASVVPQTTAGYAYLQRARTFRAVPSVSVPVASP